MERRYRSRLRVRTPLVAAVLVSVLWTAVPRAGGEPVLGPPTSQYWQFLQHTDDPSLRVLPPIEAAPAEENVVDDGPVLLAPVHLPASMVPPTPSGSELLEHGMGPLFQNDFLAPPSRDHDLRSQERAPEDRKPARAKTPQDSAQSAPPESARNEVELVSRRGMLSDYTAPVLPTGTRVQQLAQASVRRGYDFAKRGAYFTAEREFIEALKLVTRQKDLSSGRASRSEALAAGLRALDEAEDFFPGGMQLQAELDLAAIRASHLTRLDEELEGATQAQHVLDRYLRHAQVQLSAAVSGEPAGSMALHALGKLQSQLGRVEPSRNPIAAERAVALQQAALLSREDNYLAAHELGLLLAEAGRLDRAEAILAGVATQQPNAVVLRNLAAVQGRLGQHHLAQHSLAQAEALTRAGRGGAGGVQTLTPEQFAQTSTRPQNHRSTAPASTPQPGGSALRVAARELFRGVPTEAPAPSNPTPKSGTDFVSPAAQWR